MSISSPTRREFCKLTLTSLALSSLPRKKTEALLKLPAKEPKTKVVLEGIKKPATDETIAKALRNAVEATTDFSWLSKGDTVLVKPACNSGNNYPATTHPRSLKAMIEILKEKGAKRVIVSDMAGVEYVKLSKDGLRGSTRKLMMQNRLLQAAQEGGAELYFPEEKGWNAFFEDYPLSPSHWKNPIMMPKILKEIEHIVLMPRTGSHILAGTSLGLKCAVGYIRYDSRLEYHRDAQSFYEKTAEINSVPSLKNKLRLIITTSTKILTTYGPDKGYISEPETGLIISSDSLLSHDMVSLAWFLENRKITPDKEKKGIKDPHSLGTRSITNFNRAVVMLLGGPKEALKAQELRYYEMRSIWDDPVLNRGFHIFAGVPEIELINPKKTVPDQILKNLEASLKRP